MEVVHLVMGKANPDRMNGVNKVVYQLATKQTEAGIKVQIWGFTKDRVENYGSRNFPTKLLLTSNHPFSTGDFSTELRKLDKDKVVFHLHGGWIPKFYWAARMLRKAGIKYVITGHGAYNSIAMQKSKWIKKIYFKLFEKQILKGVKAIHCIGESEVKGIQSIYDTKKTILMPYGMDFIEKELVVRPKELPLIFGFVGRLDYHTKGLDLMLSAFATYFKNDPSTQLWIIGDGTGKEAVLDKINEEGIGENLILFGSKYGEEKHQLIQQMDVFLHPSRNEGMPSAVLEAASFGVPCIVTEATNIGKYVRQNKAGFVIPNEDISLLALTMLHCAYIRQQRLTEMGINAMKMVKNTFNWTHVVTQFNQLYL